MKDIGDTMNRKQRANYWKMYKNAAEEKSSLRSLLYNV